MKTLGISILVILTITTLCVTSAQAAQVSVEPAYISVSRGDTFTVNITVDPEGNETGAVDYILRFNNTLLNATLLTHGTFFDGFTTDDTYGEGIILPELGL